MKYKSKSFCEKLLAWVESSGCARIIVLSSSHSYHRTDVQLRRYGLAFVTVYTVGICIKIKVQYIKEQYIFSYLEFRMKKVKER